MEEVFSDDEWNSLAKRLEDFHSVFSKFWSMGKPTVTRDIPTCAVAFDKAGQQIMWSVNPDFWETLSDDGKLFAIAHECMHVVFSHGVRSTEMLKNIDPQIINVAMDIAVNSHLESHYGFERAAVEPPGVRYIWLDEVLPGEQAGRAFEYYVEALLKDNPQCQSKSGDGDPTTVDDHGGLGDFTGGDLADMLKRTLDSGTTEDLADMAQDDASDDMKKKAAAVSKGIKPGNNPGNTVLEITSAKYLRRKPKWETVVKKWSMRALEEYAEVPSWTQPSRRLDPNMMGDCILPSPGEQEGDGKNRIRVSFFLDTSGSCISYATRFFRAAGTLDPRKFDIKLYCFDTRVYDTDLKSAKVYGGGGTAFSIIERRIQKEMADKSTCYPDAVWVLSDGYGDTVRPEKPKRWHWFLTEGGSRDYGIHPESNVHHLKNFE
jgi:hypothetical protein